MDIAKYILYTFGGDCGSAIDRRKGDDVMHWWGKKWCHRVPCNNHTVLLYFSPAVYFVMKYLHLQKMDCLFFQEQNIIFTIYAFKNHTHFQLSLLFSLLSCEIHFDGIRICARCKGRMTRERENSWRKYVYIQESDWEWNYIGNPKRKKQKSSSQKN